MESVTVLVCTRDRPESLRRTVQSILADTATDFELIVMDQSDGSESQQALRELSVDPRLRYHRTQARGKGASLNEGLRAARNAIVACTDDDCAVSPGWASGMAMAMERYPHVAVVFCNVLSEPYDRSLGYVPAYERKTERVLSSVRDVKNGLGLGAGMAVRREAVLSFGGFDETFGPGGRFRSGDDWDLAIRALLRGWHVYDTVTLSVLHYGFRTLADGKEHARRDWVAIGALCAKPLRAGYWSVLPFAVRMFVGDAIWPPMRDVFRLVRPRGLSRVLGFLQGFSEGFRTPVDVATLSFKSR
jgi:glycosyltransferase involved in cell wall biosynthesis